MTRKTPTRAAKAAAGSNLELGLPGGVEHGPLFAFTPHRREAWRNRLVRRNGWKWRKGVHDQAALKGVFDSEVKAIYRMASTLTKQTGVRFSVDHIIPLLHPDVCGLHVPWNMSILPLEVNRSKSNRWSSAEQCELFSGTDEIRLPVAGGLTVAVLGLLGRMR